MAADLDKQRGEVPAGSGAAGQCHGRRLDAGRLAHLVVELVGDLTVYRRQHGDGVDAVARIAQIGYPVFHNGLVLREYQALIGCQVDLFRRVVLEGKTPRIVLEHKLQRLFLVVLDHHVAGDDEVLARLHEVDHGHGITIDVALPADLERRADIQLG